jgi:cytochrome c peroxidase
MLRGFMRRLAVVLVLSLAAACGDDPTLEPPPTDPNHALTADEEALTPQQLLGKRVFEDLTLSEPAGTGCISCHDPAHAYTGDHGSSVAGVSAGAKPGTFTSRNAPTLAYASSIGPFKVRIDNPAPGTFINVPLGGLLHDGSMPNLSDQAGAPFVDPTQLAAASAAAVVGKLEAGVYAPLFRRVNGEGSFADRAIAFRRVQDALAAYELSPRFHAFSSRFDDVLRGTATLSAVEAEGQRLFEDPLKGNCIACHVVDPASKDPAAWLFTDRGYFALGVPRNDVIPANADPTHFDLGLCQAPGLAAVLPVGLDPAIFCGLFRVPTLRNVALTAPYMHNGAFASLRDAVAFHITRDTQPERWYPTPAGGAGPVADDLPAEHLGNLAVIPPLGNTPGGFPFLSDAEIDAVVAFLGTLSDR